MNRKRVFQIFATLGAGVLMVFLFVWISDSYKRRGETKSGESVRSAPTLLPRPEEVEETLGDDPAPKTSEDSIGAKLVTLLRSGKSSFTKEDVEAFVEGRSRDRDSLIAAYRMMGLDDRERLVYLQEAWEKFPDDPAVAAAVLMETIGGPLDIDVETVIDTFTRIDPDNSLPSFLKVSDLVKHGKVNDALSEIHNIMDRNLKVYDSDFARGKRDFYKSIGLDDFEASLLAGAFEPGLDVISRSIAIKLGLRDAFEEAQDVETKEAIIAAAVVTAQQFADAHQFSLRLTQLSQEVEFLGYLEGDTKSPYFGEGLTGSELLASAEHERQEIRELLRREMELLASIQDTQTAEEFASMIVNEGQVSTYRWLADRLENDE